MGKNIYSELNIIFSCDAGKYQYWHTKILDVCVHFFRKKVLKMKHTYYSSFFYMYASKILFFSSIPFSNKIYFFKSHILSDSYSTNVVVLNWILQFEFWMYSSQRPVNVQLSVIKIDQQFFTQNSLENLKKKSKTMTLDFHTIYTNCTFFGF